MSPQGNLGDFNAEDVAPREAFEPLPAGEYPAIIGASEMSPTKNGDGEFLKLELEIIDGPAKGRKLFDRLNLKNPSAQAVEIARATLSAICRATGVMRPGDSAALHDRPMTIVVKLVKRADNGEMSNEVKGYKPLATEPAKPTPTAAGKPAWKR